MTPVIVPSDLHYAPAYHATLAGFVHSILKARPDCLIVAGDTGHPLKNFEAGLSLFTALPCPKLFLAGNHDVWTGEHHSEHLWKSQLARVAKRCGFRWLEAENFKSGALGLCGTIGWYDYSAKDPSLSYSDRDYAAMKYQVNNDAHYLDWPWDDRAFAAEVVAKF